MSPCDPIVEGEKIVGYVCSSATELLRTEPAGDKWCFGCRKRLPHTWQMWGSREPSYYEPTWTCICSRCHRDRTVLGL